jgi:hypothetical protein
MLSGQQLSSLACIDFYFCRGRAHCVLIARGIAKCGSVARSI